MDTNGNSANGTVDEWVPAGVVPRARDRATADANEFAVLAGVSPAPVAEDSAAAPRFDLNDVSFEVLRVHGLTIAEAARFVSYRQRRGGRIGALAEIDAIAGLSDETRSWLKRHGAL